MQTQDSDSSPSIPVHLSPPFVVLDGVLNCRALPLSNSPATGHPLLLRSGNISRITPNGMNQLKARGIRKIFDLRSPSDVAKFHSPAPVIDGVEILHVPILLDPDVETKDGLKEGAGLGQYEDSNVRKVYADFRNDELGSFMNNYTKYLEGGHEGISQILRGIINRKDDESIMFHCNAGKDRAGVVAAVILSLAGLDDAAIIHDYTLTSVGMEPFSKAILSVFEQDATFRENREGAMNMFSSRPETMQSFLTILREKYGGIENYVRNVVGLTDAEVGILKGKLR